VGFSVAFCFAVAALWQNKVDSVFAARLRPWVLAAWVFLTAGIVKGALWAYYELGWGGFWFWDPVENASLMPWLAGTALLHSSAVLEKRGSLKGWTAFLAMLAFSFSLLGTFLVRSGVLTSVHAFAADPARGVFILLLLTLAIGGAFLLYALRAPAIKPGAPLGPWSRESLMLLGNIFLFTFCATVFTGTLYPVFMNALDLGSVSVGPPYYRATLLPMLVPFALLMGAAPYAAWQRTDAGVGRRLFLPFLFTAFTLLPLAFKEPPLALLGFSLSAWIAWTLAADVWRKGRGMPLSYYGMVAAHLGFAALITGVTAATLLGAEKILWMKPGERTEVAGRELAYLGPQERLGPGYNSDTGVFTLDGKDFLAPERRWYPAAQKETSEVALKMDGLGLFYLAIGEEEEGRRVVRAYRHPLVLLVFGGGVLMYLGGALAAFDGKRRKHA
jgi:cytochrome c-type biogenesis protein CcmF